MLVGKCFSLCCHVLVLRRRAGVAAAAAALLAAVAVATAPDGPPPAALADRAPVGAEANAGAALEALAVRADGRLVGAAPPAGHAPTHASAASSGTALGAPGESRRKWSQARSGRLWTLRSSLGQTAKKSAGCMEEASMVQQQSVLSYTVGAEAASSIGYGDAFELKRWSHCGGEALPAEVWVQAEINGTSPVNGSSAYIILHPGVIVVTNYELPRLYVCFKGRAAPRRCLASVDLPRRQYRMRHFMTHFLPWHVPALERAILLMDAANSHLVNCLDFLVGILALLFLVSVVHATARLLLMMMAKDVDAPLPPLLQVQEQEDPSWTLFIWGGRFLVFSTSTATLIQLALGIMSKDAPFEVIIGLICWPCTCGFLILVQLSQGMSRQQLYLASLVNGKRMTDLSFSKALDALAVASLLILGALLVLGLVSTGTVLPVEMVSPVIVIASLASEVFWYEQVDLQRSICKVDLLALHDVLTGSAPDAQSADWIGKIKSPVQKLNISEGSLCEAHRRGVDPLQCMRLHVALPEGPGLRLWDLRWHGRAVHRMMGSKVGLANVPLLLAFALMLSSFCLKWATWYLIFPPAVKELTLTGGTLDTKFEPMKHRYSYFHDRGSTSVGLQSVVDHSSMQSCGLVVNNETIELDSRREPFSVVDTARKTFPTDISFHVRGLWRTASQSYRVRLVPVTTHVTSVMLTVADWSKCLLRRHRRSQSQGIVLLESTTKFDMDVALKHFSPTIPARFSEAPRAPELATAFEASGVSETSCLQKCHANARCLTAFEGTGGCFFALQPVEELCKASHKSAPWTASGEHVYKSFLRNRTKATIARICMSDADDAAVQACREVRPSADGHLLIRDIAFPSRQRSLKCDVQLLLNTGSQGSHELDRHTLTFYHGAPMPESFLVWGKDVVATASFREGNSIQITIQELNFTDVDDEVGILVAPALADDSYTWRWIDEDLAGDEWHPPGCLEPDFSRLSVCGGALAGVAGVLHVPKWAPWFTKARARLEPSDNRSALPAIDVQISVGTRQNEFPAAWAVRQSCSLDVRGWSLTFQRLRQVVLNQEMFAEAAAKCPDLSMLVRMHRRTHKLVFTVQQLVVFAILLNVDILEVLEALALHRPDLFEDAVQSQILAKRGHSGKGKWLRLHAEMTDLPPLAQTWLHYIDARFWHHHRSKDMVFDMDKALSRKSALLAGKLCHLFPALGEKGLLMAIHLSNTERVAVPKVTALLRCEVHRNLSLVEAEPFSAAVAAIKLRWVAVLSSIAESVALTMPILSVAGEGTTSLVERSLLDFAVGFGCTQCIPILLKQHLHHGIDTVQLSYMSLTRTKIHLSEMVRGLHSLRWGFILDVSHNDLGCHGINELGQALVEMFGNGSRLRGLRLRQTIQQSCDEATSGWFAFLGQLPRLQELDLSVNNIYPAEALALQPLLNKLPQLRALDVSANELGGTGLAALRLQVCDQLRTLRIAGVGLGDLGAAQLAMALDGLRALEDLDFSQNSIGRRGFTTIAPALRGLVNLRNLSLGGNRIGPFAADGLDKVFRALVQLRSLDLSGTHVGAPLMRALHAAGLAKLVDLNIGGCGLGAAGPDEWGGALSTLPELQSLTIDSNQFGDVGLAALENATKSLHGLRVLRCSNNSIGATAASVQSLSRILTHLVALRRLDIGGNQLGASGLRALQPVLQNLTHLETLGIHGNSLGEEGMNVLRDIVRHSSMSRLRYLDAHGNNVTEYDILRFASAAAKTGLQVVRVELDGDVPLEVMRPQLMLLNQH